MSGLLGEFEVSMDPKGRVKVPSALIKQPSADDNARFVITEVSRNAWYCIPTLNGG